MPDAIPTRPQLPMCMRVARQWSLCADDALDAYQRALEIYVRRLASVDRRTELSWLKVVVIRPVVSPSGAASRRAHVPQRSPRSRWAIRTKTTPSKRDYVGRLAGCSSCATRRSASGASWPSGCPSMSSLSTARSAGAQRPGRSSLSLGGSGSAKDLSPRGR
jgi:hypothetical protein